MIKTFASAATILLLASSTVSAQNRAGDAALGAVSGALVLGPIGAVAGAFIGYSAGPSIARSWGIDGSRSQRHRRQASKEAVRGARAEQTGSGGTRPADQAERNARVATSRSEETPATPSTPPAKTAPPVQTLE